MILSRLTRWRAIGIGWVPILWLFVGHVSAEFTTIYNVPPDMAPSFIGSDTQLNLFDGGAFYSGFDAGIRGGFSENVEVNLFGGAIFGPFDANEGSTVNISDSLVSPSNSFSAYSTVNISGGSVGRYFTAYDGSSVTISGGMVGDLSFYAWYNSLVYISGGTVGGFFDTYGGSSVTISGGGFRLDGVPVDGLDSVGDSRAFDLSGDSVLSGTLADGTPFAFSRLDGDDIADGTLTLQAATLPPTSPTTITVPGDPLLHSIRAGQTLLVHDGGRVSDNFHAGFGSVVELTGGQIGENFEAVNSQINMSGGTIGVSFDSFHGTTVTVSGGSIGVGFDAHSGSTLNFSGGSLGKGFNAFSGSTVNLSGGFIGRRFETFSGSMVNIMGGEYRLDGILIDGLDTVGDRLELDLPDGSVLSGTLADGSPWLFSRVDGNDLADGTLTLEAAALPPIGPATIVLPEDPAPRNLRTGQTLVVEQGGVVGDNLHAAVGSTVRITGGQVGDSFEAVGAQITVSEGSIGSSFDAFRGSVVNISGGSIGPGFDAYDGSMVTISGGSIISGFKAHGSAVNISGGSIDGNFEARNGSVVNIFGGSFASSFRADDGSTVRIAGGSVGDKFQSASGSSVSLLGGEFRLDGVPIGGVDTVGDTLTFDLPDGALLSGTLADGTPFAFSSMELDDFFDGTLTLEAATLPPVGPALITLPDFPAPAGIRTGQTLVVQEGGVVGDNFNAGLGSTIEITGGQVGRNFEAVGARITISDGAIGLKFGAFQGSVVNVSGGSVGFGFEAYSGSTVNISGGFIDSDFEVHSGSVANISGGTIDYDFEVRSGSVVNISGGTVRRVTANSESVVNVSGGSSVVTAESASMVNISGGSIGSYSRASSGSTVNISGGSVGSSFNAHAGSVVNLSGGEYRLDGVPIPELDTLGDTLALDLLNDAVLSGTLADGTPFVFSGLDGDDFDDGTLRLNVATLPSVGPAIITAPGEPVPQGLRAGQTLVLNEGGVVGNGFNAGWGSTIHITGGQVGKDLEVVGAQATITGGYIDANFDAYTGSTVDITGGTVEWHLSAFEGSMVNISGGSVGDSFRAFSGSTVNISGGSVGDLFSILGGSTANISGGTFHDRLTTQSGSTVNLSGGEFRLDGVPIAGLDTVGNTLAFDLPDGLVLSGTLADGTPFAFSSIESDQFSDGTLTLEAATLADVGPAVITLPDDSAPLGIRTGQTLVAHDGGIVGNNFNAGRGSTVYITGGQIGQNFEAVGAQVTILGGSIDRDFDAFRDSTVNVLGGSVGSSFNAHAGSTVNLSGGSVGSSFNAHAGSTVNLSGGSIRYSLTIQSDSTLNLSGGEFRLDGTLIDGLDVVGDARNFDLPEGALLSGTLADGMPFAFSSADFDSISDGTLTLNASTLPTIGPTVFTVPDDPAPGGLRTGQTLVVHEGGIVGDDFNAGRGSVTHVLGGQIGQNFEAVGAQVIISGGSIGSGFDAFNGSTVDVLGGSVGPSFDAHDGSTVNIAGGVIGISIFSPSFNAYSGSTVNLSGGTFGDFNAVAGSTINLLGTEFWLDHVDITSLLALNTPFVIDDRGVLLEGLLADGTSFDLGLYSAPPPSYGGDYFDSTATVTVTLLLPGDYDGNGSVDAADFVVWRDNLGSTVFLPGDTTPGTVTQNDYDVWKDHFGQMNDALPPTLPGDYNGNGSVDAADFVVWRDKLGGTFFLPGDTTPGTVTQADYDVWKTHFGLTTESLLAATANASVPEPASGLLLLVAGFIWHGFSCRTGSEQASGRTP